MFASGGATLSLGDTSDFAGVLADFAAGSAIDLHGLHVTTVSTSGTMTDVALAGGGDIMLTLGAPLGAGLFLHLASDGTGGANILAVSRHSCALQATPGGWKDRGGSSGRVSSKRVKL